VRQKGWRLLFLNYSVSITCCSRCTRHGFASLAAYNDSSLAPHHTCTCTETAV
jgi:hypothetical protein